MRVITKIVFIVTLISFWLVSTSLFIPTDNIQICVLTQTKITALMLNTNAGVYKIIADGNLLQKVTPENTIKLFNKVDSVQLIIDDKDYGKYKYIKLSGDNLSELKVKLINPDRKPRIYQNNLSFSSLDGYLKIINEVLLDNYIAGVTEAEAGSRSSLEFYKVQSVLARTFALAHINKHITEGFSLCDQVHCQAYYGKPKDLNTFTAIEATKNLVVVDESLNLIVAAFHSNCGGQTANSEDVWGSRTSYLKSVTDSFSVKMPNSKWERKMLKDDWLSYLKIKHNYPSDKEEGREAAFNFKQDTRKVYLECSTSKVPLKNVRTDLQLKSTYFSISEIGKDSVLFKGKGYGHGLGMCQEGAMRMCKLGYKYVDVLNFYYKNIQLIDLHKLTFFKDE